MVDDGRQPFGKFDLRDLGVLRKGTDREFDTAVTLAARALRAPVAVISVLDFEAGISWLRAHVGTMNPVSELEDIPIESSLFLAAMSRSDVIAIPDTARDAAAKANPFIRAQGIQSVLAAPVMCPAEDVVALVSVHDRVPRLWTAEEKESLLGIAHFCTESILLRAALRTLGMVSRRDRGV